MRAAIARLDNRLARVDPKCTDVAPADTESPERTAWNGNPLRRHAQRASPTAERGDPAVEQAERQHHQRQQDRGARDVVVGVPALERLDREDPGDEHVDPVDAMRMMRVGGRSTAQPAHLHVPALR